MAFVRLHDGTDRSITKEQGRDLWDVLTGEKEPTEAQEAFALKVKSVYLNWRNAPDSYLLQNKESLKAMVMSHWMVEGTPTGHNHEHRSSGRLTRPDPTDHVTLRVSKVLGLL